MLTYLGDSYGWGCERTPAEREKEREFYGIYFNEYHTQKNARKLQEEIAERLKATSDRDFNLEVKKANDEKDTKLAAIKAVSNVAKAYAASRPKTIYKYIWW